MPIDVLAVAHVDPVDRPCGELAAARRGDRTRRHRLRSHGIDPSVVSGLGGRGFGRCQRARRGSTPRTRTTRRGDHTHHRRSDEEAPPTGADDSAEARARASREDLGLPPSMTRPGMQRPGVIRQVCSAGGSIGWCPKKGREISGALSKRRLVTPGWRRWPPIFAIGESGRYFVHVCNWLSPLRRMPGTTES